MGFLWGHVVAKGLSKMDPAGLPKVILVNTPGMDFKNEIQGYFKSQQETPIDENGIWYLPRKDGTTTYVSENFWNSIKADEELANINNIVNRFKTIFIRASEDDVISENTGETYKDVGFAKIHEIHGNHSFGKEEDRVNFLGVLDTSLAK